jgi:hypothetical protein
MGDDGNCVHYRFSGFQCFLAINNVKNSDHTTIVLIFDLWPLQQFLSYFDGKSSFFNFFFGSSFHWVNYILFTRLYWMSLVYQHIVLKVTQYPHGVIPLLTPPAPPPPPPAPPNAYVAWSP